MHAHFLYTCQWRSYRRRPRGASAGLDSACCRPAQQRSPEGKSAMPLIRYALYAFYVAPTGSRALCTLAADWLGRDPETAENRTAMLPDWLERARWHDITAEPRLYGFPGTLKPPFPLA